MHESANDAMIRWLAKQSPEARHFTALHLNWDYALPCVAWLVSREDCDLATGVAVFWLGNPEEFLKYPSLERVKQERGDSDTFELLDRIVKREADGLYTRRQISRNPEEFGRPDLYDREAAKYRLEDLPWDLPSVFRESFVGLDVDGAAGRARYLTDELRGLLKALGTNMPTR